MIDKPTYLKMKDRAEILRVSSPDQEDYILGYLRGLAQAHQGEVNGQQDQLTGRAMEGYQDGLKVKPIGHGGPGRRTAADGASGLMRKNIMIDQVSVDVLKELGDGDLSLGIRRAATQVKK